jgi:hypothetical protein
VAAVAELLSVDNIMSATLTTESLSAAAAESLSWLSDHGFRYLKSYHHFRRKNTNGFSYITIDSVTHNRIAYHLAFFLGVQITEVESWVLSLMRETRKVSHYDRTILNYTFNIGPSSPHWQFRIRGDWTLGALEEFSEHSPQISRFVRELALPFVLEHQDPGVLRRTLIETPGHATNSLWPYRQILAIDCLYGSPEQTHSDIALLERRYQRYAPERRQEFDQFVSAVRKAMSVEQDAAPNSRQPSQLPASPEVQSPDSQRTPSSGGCG